MKPLEIDNLIKFLTPKEKDVLFTFNDLIECEMLNEVDLGEPGFIAVKNLVDINKDLKSYGELKFTTTEEKLVRKSMLILKSILEANFESLTGYGFNNFLVNLNRIRRTNED